jgi:uncharacterized protein (TIGR02145 family)
MIDHLGGNSVAGGKMKETGTDRWSEPNEGATNESGFTALPAGAMYIGGGCKEGAGCQGMKYSGGWWTSTLETWESELNGFVFVVYYDTLSVTGYHNDREYGFSIRCVKD